MRSVSEGSWGSGCPARPSATSPRPCRPLLRSRQEHETALRYFQRALQLDPTLPYAYTLCGHEYFANEVRRRPPAVLVLMGWGPSSSAANGTARMHSACRGGW